MMKGPLDFTLDQAEKSTIVTRITEKEKAEEIFEDRMASG